MREISNKPSKAKIKLLSAAERLIAEKGFDGVSVRDVTQLAKANVAAVNYHFGSREGMMGLVMVRYLVAVNEERLTRLGVLEKKWGSKGVPVEELVEAYLRPTTGVATRGEVYERWQCRLVGRILALDPGAYPEPVLASLKEVMARYVKAFGKTLSAVPKQEMWWRLHFVTGGMVHLLVQDGAIDVLSDGVCGHSEIEQGLSRYMYFAVDALREGGPIQEPKVKAGPQATFNF